MINKVTLIGRLGKDVEMATLENGTSVAKFSLATSENFKDVHGEWQEKTEWHNIVAWGKVAESAERNLQKGNLAFVEGKITTNKWQDKDGNDRYSTNITAYTLRLLEKKDNDLPL